MSSSSTTALQSVQDAFARGDLVVALTLARALLATDPQHAQALLLAANAAIRLDRDDDAIELLEQLRRIDPEHAAVARSLAAVLNRRGSRRRRAGDEVGASADFERALQLDPAQADAGFNLALSLHAQGRAGDALPPLEAHLGRRPDDAEARLLALQWRWPRALERMAIELDAMAADGSGERVPAADWALACARVGAEDRALAALGRVGASNAVAVGLDIVDALRARGDVDAAIRAADLTSTIGDRGRRNPSLKARLARLALPPIMRSNEQIALDRERFRRTLDELDEDWTTSYLATFEPRLEQLAWSNFHLAYHGRHDRDLQRRYAALIERAAASFFPALAETPRAPQRRRLGLLSSCWRDCTVGVWFGGWIDWLREAGHEVVLYQLGPHRDATTDRLAARADTFRFHRGALHELASTIRADALDLLIYPELGMDTRLLPLAALRLASRQAVAWGHPVTSGFTTIDGFFTCAEMEPVDAASHYTETLLPLPGLGVAYTRPAATPAARRDALGLPEHAVLALVPQSLFKLHPDDDAVLAGFAAAAPDAKIVLFEGEHPCWRPLLARRLAPHFEARGMDPARHLHWMPTVPRSRFLQINAECDLMIDSLRWSGGNTSIDALGSGVPIVTCPGDTLRARQSTAMLRRLDLGPELVCNSPAALVECAAALAADAEHRQRLSSHILAAQDALHDPDAARLRFLEHVARLIDTPASA